MRIIKSEAEHRARVAQLRALGYTVKTITLPNGDGLTITSKKRFKCNAAHYCAWIRDRGGAPAVPWPRKRKAKKKSKRASSGTRRAARR
jgi:hypothetical protein